jgi:hypothetical protein
VTPRTPGRRARRAAIAASGPLLALLAVSPLVACDPGPRIEARPQTITFGPAPTPAVDQDTATVRATASSGLPVVFASLTPLVCSVDSASGLVVATVTGTCTVRANQSGNATWAAAPQVTQDVSFTFRGLVRFGPPPVMSVHDLATITATESSGLPVAFATSTATVCSVDAATGLVGGLAQGDCTVVAASGQAQASITFPVSAPSGAAAPGAPSGVVGSAGDAPGTLTVRVGAVRAGGIPLSGFSVTSIPAGLSATGSTLPVTVGCPSSCSGYRLVVAATNGVGTGPASAPGDVLTRYRVVATFREPDTRPNDSIFVGTYSFNASSGTVQDLRGRLSEAMTGGVVPYPGDTMNWLSLEHPLAAQPVTLDGAAGWLVATFRLPSTGTLSTDPRFGGTDGWAPGSGAGLHFGYPGANPGNAYALVFVNAADPAAIATQGQIDRTAYADCAPGGMMGATCMTGTSVAGYGTAGTMGGHPVSQVTTRE